MNLIVRSLVYYWRFQLGYMLSLAVACAVLTGGLMVGDSLRRGLELRTEQRIGPVTSLLKMDGRWFSRDFASRLSASLDGSSAAVFLTEASARGSNDRLSGARIVAVDHEFSTLARDEMLPSPGTVTLNQSLASVLHVAEGDVVVFRFERPDALPSESLLRRDEFLVSLRLRVGRIIANEWPAEMDLRSSGDVPLNAFVNLEDVQQRVGWEPLNTMLVDSESPLSEINSAVRLAWGLDDAQLGLHVEADGIDLRSARVLLEPHVVAGAKRVSAEARSISSWFIDEVRSESESAHYVFASALEGDSGLSAIASALRNDAVAVADTLASRLGVSEGDSISLTIPVLGPRKELEYVEKTLSIQEIFPLNDATAERSLMPPIPGMIDAETCSDWDLGLPIQLSRVGPEDENHWKRFGGSPQLLVSLDTAADLWSNRYGLLSAIRFPKTMEPADLGSLLKAEIEPAAVGLIFEPLGERMRAAASPVNDFGQLFLGFNFFIILSALFLVSVFSGQAVERRRRELGLLASIGYTRVELRRRVSIELGVLGLCGTLVGSLLALGVSTLLLRGLLGVWQTAVGSIELPLAVEPVTLATGALASWLMGLIAAWLGARQSLRQSAWANLRGQGLILKRDDVGSFAFFRWIGAVLIGGACLAAVSTDMARGPSAALVFFGCGAAVLFGGLCLIWAWLRDSESAAPPSVYQLGLAGLRLRPFSSFAIVSCLSVGLFLVGGIGGGTLQPRPDPLDKSSGTGGFAWLVRLAIPVQENLGLKSTLAQYGLSDIVSEGQVIGVSSRSGDDASCLNLGSAQQPQLLGVDVGAFAERDVFHFLEPTDFTWEEFDNLPTADSLPVVGDASTIYWGLHLNVGDELSFTDESGRPFRVRIAGIVENWLFQGSLLTSRDALVSRYPGTSGDSFLLVGRGERDLATGNALHQQLADYGVVLQQPVHVLASFMGVERTYMAIFGALGGLGMLLALVGVLVLSLRRLYESASDIALLNALGFTLTELRWMFMAELVFLIAAGTVCGLGATLVALAPRLSDWGQSEFSKVFIFLVLSGMFSVACLVGLAARLNSLRDPSQLVRDV